MTPYIEETRRSLRRKRRDSSKDKNRGERKWQDRLDELRDKYEGKEGTIQPEENDGEENRNG